MGLLLNEVDDVVIADGQGLRHTKLLLPRFSLTGLLSSFCKGRGCKEENSC